MRIGFSIPSGLRRGMIIGAVGAVMAAVSGAGASAQVAIQTNSGNGWQGDDWLKPAEDAQNKAASGETFQTTTAPVATDPFTVLTSDALWQESYGSIYTRRLADPLVLSCESSGTTQSDGSDDASRGQKIGLQFQPAPELTLNGNVHGSVYDTPFPAYSTDSSGAGCSLEGHLPGQSVLTVGLDSGRSNAQTQASSVTQTNTYDAQLQQPLGPLPLTAVVKGHYEETSTPGSPASSLPSIEQSLVWKPAQDTTLQMGLRQQHYEEYPGIDNQFNEALFADWSQKIVDDISWHSYAEVLNSRGMIDQAPAAPIASGANGTPQATTPGSNISPTSSLPLSLDDQTLTFSTGPSFKIQKDLSASLEYSDRWDENPAAGAIGQEQRVSISLKGTF